jgi:hypothetical protein
MATEAERIRSEIDVTRENLAYDIDRLADRTSPSRIVNRRWESMKSKVGSMKDTVMGVSEDAMTGVSDRMSGVSDRASDLADNVREAPDTVARRTRGNPVAAGLIAFGAGLLAASLLPETDAERRIAGTVSDRAGDMLEPIKETGRQLAADVGETVKDASREVGETAKEAASNTATRARETAA